MQRTDIGDAPIGAQRGFSACDRGYADNRARAQNCIRCYHLTVCRSGDSGPLATIYLGRVNAFIPVLRIITNLCKSESLAAATEVAQFIEVSQSAGEPPCIEVERSFDGGQL
jgi:hypothetical protein